MHQNRNYKYWNYVYLYDLAVSNTAFNELLVVL